MNPSNSENQPRSGTSSSPVTLASLVIVVSFFLPYITILGQGAAGYQLHEVWKLGAYLWAIPALAALTMVASLARMGSPALAYLAGGVPFVFLTVALIQGGKDVLSALSFGGYCTLFAAGSLIACASRLAAKDNSPAGSVESAQHEAREP